MIRRLPPVGSIQAFVQVARLGSVKAAADELALSPPALTRRIQSLEQFVGAPLFDRQRNGVSLNGRGENLFNDVESLITGIGAALERAGDARETTLRLAVPSLFAAQRLVPSLRSLRDRHPNLQLELDTGRQSRLSDDVDASIVIREKLEGKFYSRLLEKGEIVALASKTLRDEGNIREPSTLAEIPILLHRDLPEAHAIWSSGVGLPKIEAAKVTYFDAGQLILDAAAEGLGVAFMFQRHFASSQDPRLVQMFEQRVQSPYSYWFACKPAALDRPAVRLFHDWLFEHFDGGQ